MAGMTASADFPTTPGAHDTTFNGDLDIWVTKFSASGDAVVWSTYLGGTDYDQTFAIAVDAAGDVYVAGQTFSSDFPTTAGVFDRTLAGGDAFVAKLSSTHGALLWSTLLGGDGPSAEQATALAVDAFGSVYVTGETSQSTTEPFPTTPGAYDTTFDATYTDGFVSKLSARGDALLWSTFLGGGYLTGGLALALNVAGEVYVGGTARYGEVPTTPGAYDTTPDGPSDAFVMKLSANGDALVWSTLIGGAQEEATGVGESITALTVDTGGNVYIAGTTGAPDFPTTPGAFHTRGNGGADTFVAKLGPAGDSLLWSTFLGGSNTNHAAAVAIDALGHVYVVGTILGSATGSFPTTPTAYDSTLDEGWSPFIAKLASSGDAILYSTLFDQITLPPSPVGRYVSAVIDQYGSVYLAGMTDGASFPTTPGSYDTSFNGALDAFIAELHPDTDGDAVVDTWEILGTDYDRDGKVELNLPALGADPLHKDLFVEVDTMVGRAPALSTLQRVAVAFADAPAELVKNPDGEAGIALHIHLDETDIPLADWLGPWAEFDDVKRDRFGTARERTDPRWNTIRAAKELVYRYAVFADTQPGGYSGLGEMPGNDFMVTLGAWAIEGGSPDQQAGTFMHELGHNLNLDHGGGDDVNYKPNYHSVMNYTWQVPQEKYANGWRLDYSRSDFSTLIESALDELAGIGGDLFTATLVPIGPAHSLQYVSEWGPVDWNGNGELDLREPATPIERDINHIKREDPPSRGQTLRGYEDWSNLRYMMGGHSNFADGVHEGETMEEEMTVEIFEALSEGNFAPVAISAAVTVTEDTDATVSLEGTDGDADLLTAIITVLPTKGRLFQTPDGIARGMEITSADTVVTDPERRVIFAPNRDDSGSPYATFRFRVDDRKHVSAQATIAVNVTAVNDRPLVVTPLPDQQFNENVADAVFRLSGVFDDVDIATNNDRLTLSIVQNTNPALLTPRLAGFDLTLDFVEDQHGIADITVRATDTLGTFVEDTFRVTVHSHEAGIVRKLYLQVLNREPENSGGAYWTDRLMRGESPGVIAEGIFESDERLNPIIRQYYRDFLFRDAEPDGLAYWRDRIWKRDGGPENVVAGMIASPEFYRSAGGTDDNWVTELYRRLLGRDPEPAGRQFWVDALQQHGLTREEVVLGFLQSDEHRRNLIVGWYQQYLGRTPGAGDVTYWLDRMRRGASRRRVQIELIDSPEYRLTPPLPPPGVLLPLTP